MAHSEVRSSCLHTVRIRNAGNLCVYVIYIYIYIYVEQTADIH